MGRHKTERQEDDREVTSKREQLLHLKDEIHRLKADLRGVQLRAEASQKKLIKVVREVPVTEECVCDEKCDVECECDCHEEDKDALARAARKIAKKQIRKAKKLEKLRGDKKSKKHHHRHEPCSSSDESSESSSDEDDFEAERLRREEKKLRHAEQKAARKAEKAAADVNVYICPCCGTELTDAALCDIVVRGVGIKLEPAAAAAAAAPPPPSVSPAVKDPPRDDSV